MTTDEENFYKDNIKIAYKLTWNYYKKFGGYIELEELKSICLLGLAKAIKAFNKDLGFNFSTYAYKVIQNEILIANKDNQKWIRNISLNTPVVNNEDILIEDVIADNFDMDENVHKSIYLQKLCIELEKLNPRYKKIIEYRLQDLTMTEIGNKIGISQAQVSRDYQKILSELRIKLNAKGET